MRLKAEFLPDAIFISWHIDDIKNIDDTLTDNQCREILQLLDKQHDTNEGINWEVIKSTIDFYKIENNLKIAQ